MWALSSSFVREYRQLILFSASDSVLGDGQVWDSLASFASADFEFGEETRGVTAPISTSGELPNCPTNMAWRSRAFQLDHPRARCTILLHDTTFKFCIFVLRIYNPMNEGTSKDNSMINKHISASTSASKSLFWMFKSVAGIHPMRSTYTIILSVGFESSAWQQ